MEERTPSLREVNLSNDFLFGRVMSDPEICKLFLESVLGIKIKLVKHIVRQRFIKHLYRTKGVILDISVVDDDDMSFNVEMQIRRDDLPKRSRYYLSSIDLETLEKGLDYEDLKPAYVIFICTFDMFGRGVYQYDFESTCRQFKDVLLGDEAYRIFLNTKGIINDVGEDLREFLRYVDNSTEEFARACSGELVKLVHRKVEKVREREELGFMTYTECLIHDVLEEARIETTKKMLRKECPYEMMSIATDFSKEKIEEIRKQLVAVSQA